MITPFVTLAAARLFSASTTSDVDDLIASVPRQKWRALGDQEGNFTLVNASADAADALVEKITNAMDALLELEVQLAGDDGFQTPRAAADRLLGVPQGRLEFLKDSERRRELAARISVTVRTSGEDDLPTIVVEDDGIGQHPEDFPNTLVSLNQNNKRDRLYLIGAYGWGGSAALAYCDYVLFVSRRDTRLVDGRSDRVGWTVVRYNDLSDERTSKTGVYEYLCVQAEDGALAVPSFDAGELSEERSNWTGTCCTLIRYQIGRATARSSTFLGPKSLRNVCNALLFDPILPFLVREERPKYVQSNPKNAEGVVIVGNAARLSELASKLRPRGSNLRDDEDGDEDAREAREVGVVHHDSYRGNLPTGGTARIRYWVMGESKKYKKDWQPARSYVPPEQAITLTHNGQRHAAWPREFFEGIGYASLGKAIVAQVDADDLSWREKRQLFATTRDKLKQTDIARALREEVESAIRQDEWLRTEEKKRRTMSLGQESKEQAERIQKMLASAISAYRDGKVDSFKKLLSADEDLQLFSDQPLADPNPPKPPGEDEEAIQPEFVGPPSFLHVLNGPVHVPAGGRAVVRLQMDAPDDYLDGGGGALIPLVTKGGDSFSVGGYSSLHGGIMRCTVNANRAAPGDRGRVVFTVTRGELLPLVDDAELAADEPPRLRVRSVGKQVGKEQGPPVRPCYKRQWDALGFDETTVAKLIPELEDPGVYTIWVSWDYPPLDSKLFKEKRLDPESAEGFKERFVAAMGFLAWLQHQSVGLVANDELKRAAEVHLFSSFLDR